MAFFRHQDPSISIFRSRCCPCPILCDWQHEATPALHASLSCGSMPSRPQLLTSVFTHSQGTHRSLNLKFPDISLILPHYQNFPWWTWRSGHYIQSYWYLSPVIVDCENHPEIAGMMNWHEMDSKVVYSAASAKPKQIFNSKSDYKTALYFYHLKCYTFVKCKKKSMKYLFHTTHPNNSVQDLWNTLANVFMYV